MKSLARIIGLVSLFAAVLAVPARSGAEALGAMRVRLVDGDVQVKIAETGEWAPVAANTPLLEGDELWVPDGSRAALQTSNGSYVRLGENTAFEVLRMDRDSFQFHLSQGHAYVLSRTPTRGVLQIDTPDASLRAFGSATFRVDVPDGETDVSAFKGSVLAESDAGTTRVRAGSMLVLAPDGFAELSPLPPPDDWERWNRDRDRIVLARGPSVRYLPEELRVYTDDFDENGRWVYVQDYGYCWTPTVLVIGDWAPYRHGRWCWRGGDYVWIGYEPWGWAPYHYGRWSFVARVGWCWVPPERGNVYWGPGYVGWVRTPEYVAWVPLAPREIYYGHGNYGRYSVNVTNVNITNIRVTNVYRNVNVTNSVTVVNHTTFVTGRGGAVNRNVAATVREDFVRHRNLVVGRPPIKPVGTSYAPVARSIPEAKRPPAVIRKIDVKQLRQARPMVKESNRSTIRPAAKPRPLEVRKVDKPRSVNERIRERQQAPAPQRGPGAPQGGPPGRMERGGQPSGPAAPQERGKRETPPGPPANRIERGGQPSGPAAPQERRKRETPPPPPTDRLERNGERPQGPPPEKIRPEERQSAPGGDGNRGRRNVAPAAPADRGQRDAAPAVKKAPSPPAKPERGIERGQPQEAPVEKSRPQRPEDNTDRPEVTPRERGERGRR